MRILVVNSFFPPRTTGSAHFAFDVAREYSRQGHDVWVVTTSVPGAPETETVDGVRVVRLSAWSVRPGNLAFNYALPFVSAPGAVRTMRRLFDEVRPDVVHQNGQFFDLTFLTTLFAWRRNVPRVLTVHTPLMHTNPVLRALIAATDRTVLRLLNAPGRPVIAGVDRVVSEMAQRRYRPRRGPVRFIPATLRVGDFGGGAGQPIRERYALADAPVILSLGHVIPIRSRVPLIRALPYIVEEFPDVEVLIAGEVYDAEFRRVAAELGVASHVVEAGAVAHGDVPDYLAAATIAAHDLDGHMLGISTLETMAAGVPVFARVRRDVFPGIDLDAWPDLRIVESAPPRAIADSICDLLRSPALRARVAQQQREFVDAYFRVETVAAQYLAIIDGLTGGATSTVKERVCITIPFHSNLPYLDAALQSLIAQVDEEWTAIVVDDASSDPDARQLVVDLGDDRVRYVRNDTNLGVAGNFNRCLQLGRDEAEIVTIFHADDMLEPGYVAAIRRAHQTFPAATCIAPRATVIDSRGQPIRTLADFVKRMLWPLRLPAVLEGDRGLARLVHGQFFYCPAVSYRVDHLAKDPFDQRWKQVMDLDLYANVLLDGGSIAVIPDRVYRYRRHDGSMTAQNSRSSTRAVEEVDVISQIAGAAANRRWSRTVRAGRMRPITRLSDWWSRRT